MPVPAIEAERVVNSTPQSETSVTTVVGRLPVSDQRPRQMHAAGGYIQHRQQEQQQQTSRLVQMIETKANDSPGNNKLPQWKS